VEEHRRCRPRQCFLVILPHRGAGVARNHRADRFWPRCRTPASQSTQIFSPGKRDDHRSRMTALLH